MKAEITDFYKKRYNLKFLLWAILLFSLFTLFFWLNAINLGKSPKECFKIDLGTKEAREHLLSGWSNDQKWGEATVVKATEKESSFIASLPKKETYRLTIKAFSVTPLDIPNQKMRICFNAVALDQFEFKKTPKWQKFRVTIPYRLIAKENTLKLSYPEELFLSPVVFDYLKFKNYVARLHKGIILYFLYDPPTLELQREEPSLFIRLFFYPPPPRMMPRFKAFGFSLVFIILLWAIWPLSSRFLYLRTKLELSRLLRLDLLTYLPSLILLLFFALISFVSSYNIVYSHGTFFILALAPAVAFKTWFIYRDVILRVIDWTIKTLRLAIVRPWLVARGIGRTVLLISQGIRGLRSFLVEFHKKDLSSAFILDFALLLFVAIPFLLIGDRITTKIAEWLAKPAYYLLLIGFMMKLIRLGLKRRKQ